ncbi:Rhodanese-like protein [Cucurbitaria berberidis CBS 394.84]|uniref:Rhodanese-like protein n=1 Tax=Cucurbitaria berberidis CBS 394.84 TaxID=1168544 RepID=A0A9P4GQF3_9PLEO|nr:Rhodanese-like protein [Cucurbitaria berberidis CBS 394.84]KAF1850723.1 Rhodanese-like protein [Cucurbitaria berberidis CBS 394.84]
MASKRAVQLLRLRPNASSVVGPSRPTGQLSFQTARALGVASWPQRQQVSKKTFESASDGVDRSQLGSVQRRWNSQAPADQKSKVYEFEDILAILEEPSNSRLLIDVREPHEYEANTIPTAINIPVTSQPDALLLDEEDFRDRFGFAKPPTNKEVVFFCKAGVRSRASAGIAKQAGYTNVGEYRGSWLDWERHGGPGTKTPPPPGGLGEPKAPVSETKPTDQTGSSGVQDLGPEGQPKYPDGAMGKQ